MSGYDVDPSPPQNNCFPVRSPCPPTILQHILSISLAYPSPRLPLSPALETVLHELRRALFRFTLIMELVNEWTVCTSLHRL